MVTAAGRECTVSSELQDCDSGISGRCCDNTYCNNCSFCLDGRHAGARETLSWRRSVVKELELRHVVLLCGSLARTAVFDGKGQDDG